MKLKRIFGALSLAAILNFNSYVVYADLPQNTPYEKQQKEEANYDNDLIFGDEFRVYDEFEDLFSIPTAGEITSPFGWRESPISGTSKFHFGIDIAAKAGTPVCAVKRGVIVHRVDDDPVYGINVKVQHEDGSVSYYAHLQDAFVNVGDKVTKGQQVGEVGTTGASTGNHLHFEIVINGENVDPTEFIFQSSNKKGIEITDKNLVKNKPKEKTTTTNSSNTAN